MTCISVIILDRVGPAESAFSSCMARLASPNALHSSRTFSLSVPQLLELGSIEEQRRPLSDSQRVKFAKEIKGHFYMYIVHVPVYVHVFMYIHV